MEKIRFDDLDCVFEMLDAFEDKDFLQFKDYDAEELTEDDDFNYDMVGVVGYYKPYYTKKQKEALWNYCQKRIKNYNSFKNEIEIVMKKYGYSIVDFDDGRIEFEQE